MKENTDIKFSIIIPTRDNPQGVQITLDHLLKDESLENFEIFVVNDGANPVVSKALEKYASLPHFKEIKVQPPKGSYFARNRGIDAAQGKYLVFLDDEMELPPFAISTFEPVLEKYPYAGGSYLIKKEESESLLQTYFRLISFPFIEFFEKHRFCGTGFLVVERNVFEKVGKFNELLYSGGDREFGERVHAAGIPQCFLEDHIAWHKGKPVKKYLLSVFRVRKGMQELTVMFPERYGRYRINLPLVLKHAASGVKQVITYRKNKNQVTRELNFFQFSYCTAVYYTTTCLALVAAWIFPRKKFNW
jgi:glycosyltransferase AglI